MDNLKDTMKPFWLDSLQNNEHTTTIFSTIGRLIYVCQRFEVNCRRLSKIILLQTKEDIFASTESYLAFLKKIESSTLYANIRVVEKLKLIGDPVNLLSKARESRNYIAHELTIGMESRLNTLADESRIKSTLTEHARVISNGEFVSMWLLSPLTKEPLPNFNRTQQTEDWVLGKK